MISLYIKEYANGFVVKLSKDGNCYYSKTITDTVYSMRDIIKWHKSLYNSFDIKINEVICE